MGAACFFFFEGGGQADILETRWGSSTWLVSFLFGILNTVARYCFRVAVSRPNEFMEMTWGGGRLGVFLSFVGVVEWGRLLCFFVYPGDN